MRKNGGKNYFRGYAEKTSTLLSICTKTDEFKNMYAYDKYF